jgi:protein SCO1
VLEDFELIDSNGKSVRFSTLRGRPAYVFFGFTRCPDVCHTALYKLKLLTQAAGPASHRPHVVMISVDGVNDTPRALRRFLRAYPSEFIGLTGDTDRLHQVAAQFSAASFPAMTKDRKGRYLVDHSAHIYLVDASGRLRATFFNPSVEAMARIGTQVLCRTAQVPVAGTGPPCIAATAFTIASPSP